MGRHLSKLKDILVEQYGLVEVNLFVQVIELGLDKLEGHRLVINP